MSGWSLREWWRNLWRARRPGVTPAAPPTDPRPARSAGGFDDGDGPVRAAPTRHRYHSAAPDEDPAREAHLGAVLEALRGGAALSRAELGTRVGAAEWGPGALGAVLAHGVAAGVLVEAPDGAVRARYAD